MKRIKILLLSVILLFSGCQSLNIQTTKQWEGHYYSVDDAKAVLENTTLDKNESIWMISNTTLKHILKNNERK